MKKLFALMLLCTAISFCLLSCSKDDDFSLVGTYYSAYAFKSATFTFYGVTTGGEDMYYNYQFTSSTQATYTLTEGSPYGSASSWATEIVSYTLNYPKITIIHEDQTKTGEFSTDGTLALGNTSYKKN